MRSADKLGEGLTCKNCRFASKERDARFEHSDRFDAIKTKLRITDEDLRRHPPPIVRDYDAQTEWSWPIVQALEWCGEHAKH